MEDFIDKLLLAESSKKCYRSLWKIIEPYLDSSGELTVKVQTLITNMEKEGYKAYTIRSVLYLLKIYFRSTGRNDQRFKDELRYIRSIEQEPVAKALTNEEATKLFSYVEKNCTPEETAAIALGLFCGLRVGEALGVEDSALFNGKLIVNKTIRGKTKTRKSRAVRPPVWLYERLLGMKGFNGLTEGDINKTLKGACAACKIKPITFHGLRHTFATMALESGASPKLVQEALGHSSMNTTLDIYWSARGSLLNPEKFMPDFGGKNGNNVGDT